MSNERLRAAMTAAGLDAEALADQVGVDWRTIERWVSGRTPHPRNRNQVARALGVAPHELWPDQEPAPGAAPKPSVGRSDEPAEDVLATYVGSQDPDLPDVMQLLDRASIRIGLLGLTLADLITGKDIVDLLATKATAGTQIRILLAAPDSVHLQLVAAERWATPDITNPPVRIWELEQTLGYLQPLLQAPNVKARSHVTEHANTILLADDQLLAALHLYAAGADHEPIVHLHQDGRFFDLFCQHFELIWEHASDPIQPDPDLYPDPDEHPDPYHPLDPQHAGPRYGPYGPTPRR